MKHLCVPLLVISAVCIAGEELSPAEKEYKIQSEALKREYMKKEAALCQKLVTALQAQLADLTKKGDFDNAIKVKEKINKYSVMIALPDLIGRWDVRREPKEYHSVWTFTADGKVTDANNGNQGEWAVEQSEIKIKWRSGNLNSLMVPRNGEATGDSFIPGKGQLLAKKID